VARARLSLKGLNRTLDQLKKSVKELRGKAAAEEKQGLTDLYAKLTDVQTAMRAECPDHLFRNIEMAAAPTAARRRRAKTARKGGRKGTGRGR
jgi:hypothetical protein